MAVTAILVSTWIRSSISVISLVASPVRSARLRTSSATTALVSGPRSDGGVQGQHIGLVGNVVDYADDLSCLVRLLAQFLAKKT
jgi:hypothetical protein